MALTYLALGDSYTIGEQVLLTESYPYQTIFLLRKQNVKINAPEIIAKTGWTTEELQSHINAYQFSDNYDIVTLLIGVNNQYRGQDISIYKKEFAELLAFALNKAGNKRDHVFVISIPDWGVTDFAADRDREKIAKEIDDYNREAKAQAIAKGVMFIDITADQRKNHSAEMQAGDGLHPSANEYSRWSEKLSAAVRRLY